LPPLACSCWSLGGIALLLFFSTPGREIPASPRGARVWFQPAGPYLQMAVAVPASIRRIFSKRFYIKTFFQFHIGRLRVFAHAFQASGVFRLYLPTYVAARIPFFFHYACRRRRYWSVGFHICVLQCLHAKNRLPHVSHDLKRDSVLDTDSKWMQRFLGSAVADGRLDYWRFDLWLLRSASQKSVCTRFTQSKGTPCI